jgi:alpha-beta hydrolase superfamily lysophospholipase
MRRAALLSLLVVLPLLAQDSPLVEAAKSSRRGRSKTVVITNATLDKKGGHLTTTKSQEPLKVAKAAPPPAPAAHAKSSSKKHAPAKHAAAPPKHPLSPVPVDDAIASEPEDFDPENIHDRVPDAIIPPQLAGRPQFSQPQPQVVAPVTPQYTEQPKQ